MLPDNCNKQPRISVLIPTRNGAKTLSELLAMLSIQTITVDEILVADSSSEDTTVEIVKQYGAQVFSVDPANFDHGGTRTWLSQKSQGDILVFLTQDTLLKRRDSIEKLITPLLEDNTVATTYGRQLPAFNADFFARSLRSFNYPENPAVRALADKQEWGLKTAFTSNSFASYRRSFLEHIGFFKDGLIFGEDTIAVARLLEQGGKIAYVPEAVAYHSHNYSPIEEFKRYFDIGVLHSSENWIIQMFGSAEGHGKKYIQYILSSLYKEGRLSLLPEFIFRTFLKYCGYKLGRYYKVLPKRLVPQLSLHQPWWLKQ